MLCHCGMLQTDLYPRCYQDAETTLHCLRDCEFSTLFFEIYNEIVYMIGLDKTSVMTLSFWLLAGSCGALETNRVLLMKWYLPIPGNSS